MIKITKEKEPLIVQAYDRPLYLVNTYEDMRVRTEPIPDAKPDQEAFKAFVKAPGKSERPLPTDSKLLFDTFGEGKEITKGAYEKV